MMSISSLISTVVGFVFSALAIVMICLLFAVVPLSALRKPAGQTRKTLLILSFAAAGVLVLSSLSSIIFSAITLYSAGTLAAYLPGLLLGLLSGILGAAASMAFPITACIGTKAAPLKGLVLILPILLAFSGVLSCSGLFNSYLGSSGSLPASVPAVLAHLLIAAVLVLAMVWYLTGQKAVLTRVILIASPAAFVLCLILALISVVQWTSTFGISMNFLILRSWGGHAFPMSLSLLLAALFALAARALALEKAAAPAPSYPAGYPPVYPGAANNIQK